MMRRALEDWSNSSKRRMNHNFMSRRSENQPIRSLSVQLDLLAPVESETPVSPIEPEVPVEPMDTTPEAPVEPVETISHCWNTTVILTD